MRMSGSESPEDSLKKILCKSPALTYTAQLQFDLALGTFNVEIQFAATITTHGQVIVQSQGGTLYGLGMLASASVAGQPGVIWRDASPGDSQTSSYILNAFGADGRGAGGSLQLSADGVSAGSNDDRARLGPSYGVGLGAVVSGGKLNGNQWASSGMCGND